MALFALYFDIFWWYLSHISLLWRWRKPEDVEKKIVGLGFYTVLRNRGSWVQFRLWHYLLCIMIFSGGIWVIYHYYGYGGSQKMLKKKILRLGSYTVLWNRGSWVQFRFWHYMLCFLIFSGGIWVIYNYYGDGGSQKMLKKKKYLG